MRFTVTPVDAAPAAALLDAYFAERAAGFPTPGGYVVARPDPARFVPPEGLFLVAEDDSGRPVGCGGLRRLDAATLEVKHLYVDPAARGQRLGHALLAELEARARAEGATRLVLDTNRSLAAANRLYSSAGFTPIEPYNDNPNATSWYGKPLEG